MNLTKEITQKQIAKVACNGVDKQGNKIKLRSVSLANLLDHVQNIPFKKTTMEKITVLPVENIEFRNGLGKALSAKEQMITNILKKAPKEQKSKIVDFPKKEKTEEAKVVEEKTTAIPVKDKVIEREFKRETRTEETKTIDKSSEVSTGKNASKSEDKRENSFDDLVAEIKNVTESVQEVKMRAEEAEAEASNSTEALTQLGIEETEVAKSLEAAKTKKLELERAVIAAYNNQKNTLVQNRKKYEDIIAEANRRKEENQNKIAKFQTKIEKDRQVLTETENEIAKLQEIYNAVNFGGAVINNNNVVPFNSSEQEAVKTMRIA